LRCHACLLLLLRRARAAFPLAAQVCVGAACPEERLHLLLHLLEPSGGKLLAPVDSDLRLYSRSADGSIKHRLVSSVRFSDLEVRPACGGYMS
jgi:hypothetical protein